MMRVTGLAMAAAPMLAPMALRAEGYRAVTEEVIVGSDALSAWTLWTTDEGFQSFFPSAGGLQTNIDLRPGGPFQIFILPGAPEGSRGCDDCVILGYEEGRMISFTWTNRPDMAVRPHKTHVVVTFEPLSAQRTRVVLIADGWGTGPDWNVAYAYFDKAWASVLLSFKARIEQDERRKADAGR